MQQCSPQPQRRRIAVAARIRPQNTSELEQEVAWAATGQTISEVRTGDTWAFDNVFGPDLDNAGVVEACCSDVVQAFCDGVNGTVLTYGQTASGKTHTMHGPEGVVPQSVEEVFSTISQSGPHKQFLLTASYVEIYNEQVFDLLAGGEVCTMEGQNGLVLQNLTHIAVSCSEDVMEAVGLGERRRRVGETSANRRSSRSHVLLRLGLESRVEGETSVRYSQLNLGDLAGSEGLRHVELTTREQRREGKCINKSLLALSQVVAALSEGVSRGMRARFRDSKLTRILQPSLGGNAQTVIICTLAPGVGSRAESRSTLDFAARARCVENSVSVNIRRDGHQDSQIRCLEHQIRELRDKVVSLESCSNTICADSETKELSEENENLKRKIERLEAALLGGRRLSNQRCLEPASLPTPTGAAAAVSSGQLQLKRRRRTIACCAEKERVGLSETTVHDLKLQLPDGLKLESVFVEPHLVHGENQNGQSSCGTLVSNRLSVAPSTSLGDSSIFSIDGTPPGKHSSFTCPRLGNNYMTPTSSPRSALRQPGFLSHRPLRKTSQARMCEDIHPVAISFSPISLSSIGMDSPIAGHDADASLDDRAAAVDEELKTELFREHSAPSLGHVESVVSDECEALRLEPEVAQLTEADLAQSLRLHDPSLWPAESVASNECEILQLKRETAQLEEASLQLKRETAQLEEASLAQSSQFQDPSPCHVEGVVPNECEVLQLKREIEQLKEENLAESLRFQDQIAQLKHNQSLEVMDLRSRLGDQCKSCINHSDQHKPHTVGSLLIYRSKLRQTALVVIHVLQLTFAHWRTAAVDSRAWIAEEMQTRLRQRLERCTCGERDVLDARAQDDIDLLRARERRRAQEERRLPATASRSCLLWGCGPHLTAGVASE